MAEKSGLIHDTERALLLAHDVPEAPPTTIVTFNPAYEKWVERTALVKCSTTDEDHGPMPCTKCLGWARALSPFWHPEKEAEA